VSQQNKFLVPFPVWRGLGMRQNTTEHSFK